MASRLQKIKRRKQRKTRQEQLYDDIVLEVKQVNKRLRALDDVDSWAAKVLQSSLKGKANAWNKRSGTIKIHNQMNLTQLRAIDKSVTTFLRSPTSTKKGIERARRHAIDGIMKMVQYQDLDLTRKEYNKLVENIYNFMATKDYMRIIDSIPYGEFFSFVGNSISEKDTTEEFIDKIGYYIDFGNDEEMKDSLRRVYDMLRK